MMLGTHMEVPMKRLFVALSTLALMLVAAPANAVHQPVNMCDPIADPPQSFILQLTADITTNQFQGPLSHKMCKSELAACKKVSTSIRKCKDAATKAQWKTGSLRCQLIGVGKKQCTDTAKGGIKLQRDQWKADFVVDKANCDAAYQNCKNACNAP